VKPFFYPLLFWSPKTGKLRLRERAQEEDKEDDEAMKTFESFEDLQDEFDDLQNDL